MARQYLLCALLPFAVSIGCEQSTENRSTASIDSRFILSTEPAGAVTPTEAMDAHSDDGPIVLVGRVDAGDIEPFEQGIASFMLSELPDAEHAGGDPNHADNCPFCRRKLEKAPKAVVRVVGDDGSVVQVDARELLGISKGDTLVVRGTGGYREDIHTVEIAASGVFLQ